MTGRRRLTRDKSGLYQPDLRMLEAVAVWAPWRRTEEQLETEAVERHAPIVEVP